MATISIVNDTGLPRCTGCGEVMHIYLYGLDSHRGGTYGPYIREWAIKHLACVEMPPTVEIAESGLRIIDRRRYRI